QRWLRGLGEPRSRYRLGEFSRPHPSRAAVALLFLEDRMPLRRRTALLVLLALAASPGWAQKAGGLDARIEQEVQRVTPQIVELRHKIHQNPELSNRETATAARVGGDLK